MVSKKFNTGLVKNINTTRPEILFRFRGFWVQNKFLMSNRNPIITVDLQNFLKVTPSIKEVYFDINGNHYFNVFKLSKGKDRNGNEDTTPQKDWNQYGKGIYSHSTIIPGSSNWEGSPKLGFSEQISKGDPMTLIANTMTRDEVIAYEINVDNENIVSKIANLTKSEKLALKELLNSDEE